METVEGGGDLGSGDPVGGIGLHGVVDLDDIVPQPALDVGVLLLQACRPASIRSLAVP